MVKPVLVFTSCSTAACYWRQCRLRFGPDVSFWVCVILIRNLVVLHARETLLPEPAKTWWGHCKVSLMWESLGLSAHLHSCVFISVETWAAEECCFTKSFEFRSRQMGCCQWPSFTGRKASSRGYSCSLSRYIIGWVLCHHLYLNINWDGRFKGFDFG